MEPELYVRPLSFLLPLALVLGCDGGDSATDSGKTDADADTDTDTDSDTDSDTDTDTDADTDTVDTAKVWFTHVGSFTANQGQLTAVDVGWAWLLAQGWPVGGSACSYPAPGVATAPGDCPTCDWSFDISASNSTSEGPGCEALAGADGGAAQDWPLLTEGFGWSDVYVSAYDGATLTDVVWEYYIDPTYGTGAWTHVAYNYNGYGYVDGNSSGATFVGKKYTYYYY